MYFHQVCVPGECEGAIIGLQTEVVSRKKAEEVGEYGAQVSRYRRAAGVKKKMQPGGNCRKAEPLSQRAAHGSLSKSRGSPPWTISPHCLPLFGQF